MALAMTSAQAIVIDFDDLDAGTVVDGSFEGWSISTDGFGTTSPDVAVPPAVLLFGSALTLVAGSRRRISS